MLDIKISKHGGRTRLTLSGELNIYAAAEAKRTLAGHLAIHDKPELDLVEVSELDTAGAQLLLWLKRRAQATGKDLPIIHHSPAVVDVMDLLNLTSLFGDVILIPPSRS